jgi:hypothetical protein
MGKKKWVKVEERRVVVRSGHCTGRNGTFDIGGVSATHYPFSGMVCVRGVSRARGILLNGGLDMDADAARDLARHILDMLGTPHA